MFKCRISLIIIFSVVSFYSVVSAQDVAPIKWGEIPMSDLKMKSFPDDTNATALRDEPYITTIDDYYNKVDVQ